MVCVGVATGRVANRDVPGAPLRLTLQEHTDSQEQGHTDCDDDEKLHAASLQPPVIR